MPAPGRTPHHQAVKGRRLLSESDIAAGDSERLFSVGSYLTGQFG